MAVYFVFEMAAGHVVSRMIFQAITADRNARSRALPEPAGQRKTVSFRQIDRQNSAKTGLQSQQDGLLLLSSGFLKVRYLSML